MGISPDVGGRQGLGKPLEPDYRELEATAQVEVAKASLGIVQNTLEVPFTQLGGNLWQYKANSAKPEMPLNIFTGVSYPDAPLPSKAEIARYKRLVEELPLKLGLELSRESRKPSHERKGDFLILDQILKFAAKALVWLESICEINPALFSENTAKNTSLHLLALNGWITTANHFIDELAAIASQFSQDGQVFRDLKENINLLKPFVIEGKEVLNTEDKKNSRALLNLIKRALALQKNYKQQRISNALGITESLIEALIPILMVLTKEKANPFFLHLVFCNEGFRWKETKNESFYDFLKSVLTPVSEISESEQTLIAACIHTLSLLMTTLTSEAGGLISIDKDEKDSMLTLLQQKDAMHSLSCKLASCLLTSCGLLPFIANRVMPVIVSNEDYKKAFSEAAILIAMNILILSSVNGSRLIKNIEPLLGGMQKAIHLGIEHLKEMEDIIKDFHLLTSIRQADLAMQKEDGAGYLKALQLILQSTHTTKEKFQEQTDDILIFATTLLPACYRLSDQNKLMTIVSQAA